MTSSIAPLRRTARAVLGLFLVVALVVPAVPAMAWGNNGDEYGTHDWIIDQAVKVTDGKVAGWFDAQAARLASDDPDTVESADGNRMEHVYKTGGKRGGGVDRIAREYDLAQAAYTAGDFARASYHIGLLAHILGDLAQPFHTNDLGNGHDTLHTNYERLVQTFTRTSSDKPAWQSARRTVTTIGNIRTVAAGTAAYSRSKYTRLYSVLVRDGVRMTSDLSEVTGLLMKRVANDLADIIWSISTNKGAQPAIGRITFRPNWTGVASNYGQTVQVWVKDVNGRPVEGIRVEVLWPTASGTRLEVLWTDPSGYQKRNALVGTSPRQTRMPVSATTTVRGTRKTTTAWWAITPALASGSAGLRTVVPDATVVVGQTARVVTVARDASGRPIRNLLVDWTWKFSDGRKIRTRAITDSYGKARSTLLITAGMARGSIAVSAHTQAASHNRTVYSSLKLIR